MLTKLGHLALLKIAVNCATKGKKMATLWLNHIRKSPMRSEEILEAEPTACSFLRVAIVTASNFECGNCYRVEMCSFPFLIPSEMGANKTVLTLFAQKSFGTAAFRVSWESFCGIITQLSLLKEEPTFCFFLRLSQPCWTEMTMRFFKIKGWIRQILFLLSIRTRLQDFVNLLELVE